MLKIHPVSYYQLIHKSLQIRAFELGKKKLINQNEGVVFYQDNALPLIPKVVLENLI